jgi:DNA-binding CsgD family transcriptional regulator
MARWRADVHDPRVGKALLIERVRSDVEVLARAGLDVGTFLQEADASLRRAVPYEAMCVSLQDPATSMTTATFKFGAISGRESHDQHWCEIEFGGVDATSFRDLARRGVTAVGMHRQTGGDVKRSVRMSDFMLHHFGFTDELRALASAADGRNWAVLAMMRADASSPFDDAEIDLMTSLSPALATGIRAGVLARCAGSAPTTSVGPGVVIVHSDDTFAQINPAAAHWLDELGRCDNSNGPVHTLASLIDGARRYARGELDVLPRSRVRVPSGAWLLLDCSPLYGPGSTGTDVVITIEEARPPEIVPLVVAAFDLTVRERDVTQLVLQGISSKEVASTLHISVHTVQDHLKSVFEKAGVRSRRELIARVFFDQYLPRLGADVTPSGWFAASERP